MQTLLLQTKTPGQLGTAAKAASQLLSAGACVALPTETVYGLAADALNDKALLGIFEAKERPFFDPLIVHLPDRVWAARLAHSEGELVQALMEAYWPGPLTLVLPKRAGVPDVATSGLSTVALRMSAHPVLNAVLEEFGRPVAAPSANRFGRISPTSAQHVLAELGGRIPLVVDGGPTALGLESTIVAPDGNRLRILRRGPIAAEALAAFADVIEPEADNVIPEAPGQLKSHYAPRTPMQLVPFGIAPTAQPGKACGLLAWRQAPESSGFAAVEVLSPSGDLSEAATRLFGLMRRLDEAGLDIIIAESVPENGIGAAIMDRLRKASSNE